MTDEIFARFPDALLGIVVAHGVDNRGENAEVLGQLGAICRRWNWEEADCTKLTEATHKAVLVIEALPPVAPELLDRAVADLVPYEG